LRQNEPPRRAFLAHRHWQSNGAAYRDETNKQKGSERDHDGCLHGGSLSAAKAGEIFAALKLNLTAETGVKPAPRERRARKDLLLAIKLA
jgi:hypothetical protein